MTATWRSWLWSIVVAAVLSTSVALLGVAAVRATDADYFDNVTLLRQLREVDARSEAQVLRALTGIDVNYDALAASLADTARLGSLIDARVAAQQHTDVGRLRAALGLLNSLENAKTEAIERFKSANAIVRNSLAFLPTAQADLVQAYRGATGSPAAPIARANDAFVAIVSRMRGGALVDDHDMQASLARVAKDRISLTRDGARRLDIFLAHAKTALEAQQRVDGLVRDITQLGTSGRIDAVGDLLVVEQKKRSDGRLAARNFLLVFATLVLALFILAAMRLGRARAALGKANLELQGANAHLEVRVAQRTSELYDANLIVRNSSTILYRIAATPGLPLTYISPNIVRFGLDAAALLRDPNWGAALIAPEHLGAVIASMVELLRGQAQENTIEYRLPDALGLDRWVEDRRQLVRDAQGRVVEIEGIVFDVTARKQAQLALKQSEEFTHAILDSVPLEVAVLDARGIITAVNEPWRRFARLNAQDAGRPVLHTEVGADYLAVSSRRSAPDVEPEGAPACDGIRAVLQGEKQRFELEYPCHSPTQERWFRMSVAPLGAADNGVVVMHEDITERRRSETALRASEGLLERTGRIGGIGGWNYDLTSRAFEWTAQTARIHDVDLRRTPTLEDALTFYAPASRATVESAMQQSLETGCGYDLELELVTATGRPIWVRAVSEVETVDGHPVRLTGTLQDVTARRSMERDLRRSNELLATALETLPCGICVFDAETNLVAWNAEYVRLLSLPPELFEGRTPGLEDIARYLAEQGEYGPGDAATLARETVRRVMSAQAQHFERIRPDGSILEIRAARMPGGGIVATFTDISARRDAEASAQRSTRLLSNAIGAIDEAFVLFGPDQRLIFCNEEYRELYGPLASLVVAGATCDDLNLISRTSGIFKTASDDEPATFFEPPPIAGAAPRAQFRRLADGRILRSTNKAMPEGHMVGILADVTQLLRASEAAEQALLAKGQFLANISHEVRTPMNAILGLLALLQRTGLSARQGDYVARTDGAARALLGVLDAVLDFSKIESGALRLDAHPFGLEAMLCELSLIVSANVGKKALDLRFDIDPALPPVLVGDAMRLQQVLVNLMGNAVKFTPAGFVELAIHVRERRASVVSLEIVVRDTGIGIAPENQARIFAGFTQAEASITRRFGGTGLGLAISHRLVDLMGGVLHVESAVGVGSSFSFRIDLEAPASPPLQAQASADDRPLRVVLVAQDAATGASSARMARASGWQVDVVLDGDDALDELQAARSVRDFDLAIVDAATTGAIGRELRQADAGRRFTGRLPVMVLGSLQERELAWARASDSNHPPGSFLVKPFTAAMLQGATLALLDGTGAPAGPVAAPVSSRQRLAGMRILVVEDNATNQLVARELLECEGATIAIAADGEQALRALPRGSVDFDIVLMDLQMPVMDGYTAAARIRDDLGHHVLPIIAMTANVSLADRQGCLAAGMNDHIGKPFDLNALVDLLRRQTGRSTIAAGAPASHAVLPPVALAVAADAGVDLPEALARLNGNLALYAQLLAAFLGQAAATIAELRECVGAGDLPRAGALLHATKGLAATLGASAIAGAAARAEAACGPAGGARAGGDAILHCCEALAGARNGLAKLQAACEGAPAEADVLLGPLETPEVLGRLERIAQLLRASDMRALALVSALRREVGSALREPMASLDDHVGQLRFEHAGELCEALVARLRRD